MAGLGAAALRPMLARAGLAQGRRRAGAAGQAGPPGAPRRGPGNAGLVAAAGPELALQARRHHRSRVRATSCRSPAVPQLAGDRRRPGRRTADGRAAAGRRRQGNAAMPLRHAGTFLCDPACSATARRSHRGRGRWSSPESEPVAVDRDEVLLIEEWRLRADGTAIAPGTDPKEPVPFYTLNGQPSLDFSARTNERLRLRFINGCQRTVIAVKLEALDVRVMADRRPAVRAVPGPQRRGGAGAGRPGRCLRRCDSAAGTEPQRSCCTTARKPARSATIVVSSDPPLAPRRRCRRPAAAVQRPAGAARPQERPPRRSARSAGHRRLGRAGQFHRHAAARLPRQERAASWCWP